MKKTLLILLALLLTACSSKYYVGEEDYWISPRDSVYLAQPGDSRFYGGSGALIADKMEASLYDIGLRTVRGNRVESVDEAIESASNMGCRYLLYTNIVNWIDRKTNKAQKESVVAMRTYLFDFTQSKYSPAAAKSLEGVGRVQPDRLAENVIGMFADTIVLDNPPTAKPLITPQPVRRDEPEVMLPVIEYEWPTLEPLRPVPVVDPVRPVLDPVRPIVEPVRPVVEPIRPVRPEVQPRRELPVSISTRYVTLRDQALAGNEDALDRLNIAALNDKNPEARHRLGQVYFRAAGSRNDYILACAFIYMGEAGKFSEDAERCNELLTESEIDKAIKETYRLEHSWFER